MRGDILLPMIMLFGAFSVGATCNRQTAANTALDVVQTACVLFHEEIADEENLAAACGIAMELIPEIRTLVVGQRTAKAMKTKAAASASAQP